MGEAPRAYPWSTPEVLVLLALYAPHAFALTVPVRATLTEWVDIGERPLAADGAASAQVWLGHPGTLTAYAVTEGELVAELRTARGRGEAAFASAPGRDSVRTWSLVPLDAAGTPLGDPEEVDLQFSAGAGGVVAAPTSYRSLVSLTVTGGAASEVSLQVQDAWTAAAYIGIRELRSDDDAALLVDAGDLSVMTVEVYAAYQALDLDAIVPLDRFSLRVGGDLEVSGLAVDAAGNVEGGAELSWLVGFAAPRTSAPVGYSVYDAAIGRVKRRGTVAARVNLQPDDATVESYDATALVELPEDLRGLEATALLTVQSDGDTREMAEGLALSPSSLSVLARGEGYARAIPGDGGYTFALSATDDGTWARLAAEVDPFRAGYITIIEDVLLTVTNAGGEAYADARCSLAPTARTLTGEAARAVLVGECTVGDRAAEVRSVTVRVSDDGRAEITTRLSGALFATDTTAPCTARGCEGETGFATDTAQLTIAGETEGVSRAGLEVEATTFALPLALSADPSELEALLDVAVSSPACASTDAERTTPTCDETVTWRLEADGTVASDAGHAIDPAEVELASGGTVGFRGVAEATASVAEGEARLALRVQRMTVRAAGSAPLHTSPISLWGTQHCQFCLGGSSR